MIRVTLLYMFFRFFGFTVRVGREVGQTYLHIGFRGIEPVSIIVSRNYVVVGHYSEREYTTMLKTITSTLFELDKTL